MGKERRDYPELCTAAIKALDRPKTVGEIAGDLDAGWQTADKCLRFLERIGHVHAIVTKPRRIYAKSNMMRVDNEFIKELTLITKRKGTRYHTVEECLDEAIRDFIRREKHIKRY
jgi:hypothetical protein